MSRPTFSALAILLSFAAAACASDDDTNPGPGSSTTGGVGSGGAPMTGGAPMGGSLPTGGFATGGALPTGGFATGGALPTGGVPTGGFATGGALTGGIATGGFATGGDATGGIATGGFTTGGTTTGGVATGGFATGGTDTGGASTGGTETGGTPTGGTETGGTPTGGTETGGAATGGAATGGACAGPVPGTSGSNPLFTDRYTADPAAMVHDCTFYIACGHDEGNTGFVMRDWYVLSSTDMVNWTDNGGPAMSLGDFSWANANAWAGHLIERGGQFFWYVPINEAGGGMTIAVAVADSPTGPFTDAIGGPLVSDEIEMENWGFSDPGETPFTIDPNVFIDDDGQAYFYYGGFWRVIGAPLNADMVSFSGALEQLRINGAPGGGGFFEAPYVIKRNGTYYLIYAAGQNPATIDYATSNDPLGPFTYRGRIIGQLPNVAGQDAATNHAAIAEFAGQWYVVYHVSNGPNGGGTYRREVAVDKLFFNGDGTIQPVTPSSGLTF